ncbi:tripartite tricarboxylate transporter substrate binding protein [Paracoccus sp. R12_1]|nr:tripartite tricarboxylate transporter substrate binding protein [Paracoccus sp. R12_2]MBO9488399.1 tripartite tricarboxylate transporter substrate binding protein [Paracoccus sp. R12_1]
MTYRRKHGGTDRLGRDGQRAGLSAASDRDGRDLWSRRRRGPDGPADGPVDGKAAWRLDPDLERGGRIRECRPDPAQTDAPDGYTIGTLISLTVASWASGLGDSNIDDFEVLAVVQNSPSFLFVPASSPYQTAEDLFAYAKENPGELTVATSGYGTQDDVTLKLLAKDGVQMENVPFQSPGERYASPIGGHTAVLYEEPGDVAQFLKAEQLKPLVVFSEERHPAFPDVPTSTELGYEISGLDNFRTVAVRAGTDPAIVEKLQSAVEESVASEEWQKFCAETYSCIEPVTGEDAQKMVQDFLQLITDQLAS